MAYNDKLTVTISCEACGITENESAKDYGGVRGIKWEQLGSFGSFKTVQTFDDKHGPSVKSATCKKCDHAATVDSRYTQ